MFEDEKKDLRTLMKQKLKAMSPETRRDLSAQIVARFLKLKSYKKAKTVLGYSSFGTEVETRELLKTVLKDRKRLALPRLNPFNKTLVLHAVVDLDDDLEINALGFDEPRASLPILTLKDIDLIVVPGLAFDIYGERLGRGMGCYDRLMANSGRKNKFIGLAFDCQIMEDDDLPADEHDSPVDLILTELRKINPDDALREIYEDNKEDFDQLFEELGIADEKW